MMKNRNFWDITKYEYHKILRKKSALFVLVLSILLIIITGAANLFGNVYVDGVKKESCYEARKLDQMYGLELSGRPIDSELFLEMSLAYGKIPVKENYKKTDEYEKYARKYSSIFNLMRSIFSLKYGQFDIDDVQMLTKETADSFYQVRQEILLDKIDNLVASEETKTKLRMLSEKVSIPITYQYAEAYGQFQGIMYTTGIITFFVLAYFLASIFSGEYSSGTDQLLLASKNGKRLLIYAKLFTAMTFSAGLCLLFTFITYFQCVLIYGGEGVNASFFLFMPLSVYPLSAGQAALICGICIFMGSLLISAITVFLSARMKTPFHVIIIISIIIFAPMFFSDPEKSALLSSLFLMLPTNMAAIWNVMSNHMYELGSISIEPFIGFPIISGILVILLLIFAYRGFKNHQIG